MSCCFRLCDPIDEYKKKDAENLFEVLAGNFAEIVQYNKDNRYYQNPERSSVTLETLCDIMVDNSITTSVSISVYECKIFKSSQFNSFLGLLIMFLFLYSF